MLRGSAFQPFQRDGEAAWGGSEERVASGGEGAGIGDNGTAKALYSHGFVDMSAKADGGLMFLDEIADGRGADVYAVARAVTGGIVWRIMGGKHDMLCASGSQGKLFQPFRKTCFWKFRWRSKRAERGTAHTKEGDVREQFPHASVQVDAPCLKPIIHFWAIHVAYLGKNDGMDGLYGLYHMAGGGYASQGGQIAGENDSGRFFQFRDIAYPADAAMHVCPSAGQGPLSREPV